MGYADVDDELTDAFHLYPDDANIFKRHFAETVDCLKRVHRSTKSDNVEKSEQSDKTGEQADSFKSGLYRQAFNAGVREVLDSFGPLFTEVERSVLEDPNFSLISIVAKLEPLNVTVAALDDGIANLERNQIPGCLILDLCDRYCTLEPPRVQTAYKTIYKTCLKVFFKQTADWILTAKLFDPWAEYFVEPNFEISQDDDCVSVATASTLSLDNLDQTENFRYKIALDKLPSFVPYSVAKKVLFVGESLILVKQNRQPENLEPEFEKYALDPFEVFEKIQKLLSEETLTERSFDDFITAIFMESNRNLRDLAFHVGRIDKQIALIRDLYFLGRGELFQEFILKGEKHLKKPAKKMKSRFLVNSFTNAYYSVYLTDESEILEAVNFTLPARGSIPENLSTLDCLNLVVKINWPLAGIFTPAIINIYRHSFRYLIRLKKAETTVCKIWVETKADKVGRSGRNLFSLLSKLKFFISNLLSYTFSDVIASEMHALSSSISNSETYTDLQNSVETFANNVTDYLFLRPQYDFWSTDGDNDAETVKRDVHTILSVIFDCCQDLWTAVDESLTSEKLQIADIERRTNAAVRALFKLCAAHPSNDSLANLRRRLDFSNFFTRLFHEEEC
ncbi:gamma-tubulin complex component [Nesidiocoris tenuis]|uniref:Gamma-tubulin complex component n=1 Tax=Nesidiocoris tenuis TaxID=355587 RepID=A0ABN7BGK3_9HEMI|nr:gamma-tubulin complex component [Nesidiocoris tenuis]